MTLCTSLARRQQVAEYRRPARRRRRLDAALRHDGITRRDHADGGGGEHDEERGRLHAGPCPSLSRRGRARPVPPRPPPQRNDQRQEGNEGGNRRDIGQHHPGLQPVDVLLQGVLHLAQLGPQREDLGAERTHGFLLLGRQQHCGSSPPPSGRPQAWPASSAPPRAPCSAPPRWRGTWPRPRCGCGRYVVNGRLESPRPRRVGERGAAGQVLDRVDHEIGIVRDRHGHLGVAALSWTFNHASSESMSTSATTTRLIGWLDSSSDGAAGAVVAARGGAHSHWRRRRRRPWPAPARRREGALGRTADARRQRGS